MESTEKKDFYFEFEKKYRGSRELIKERQRVYIPFALKCKDLHSNCNVFDMGCGRGEWLELLAENEISARGADLDDDMIALCKERGFLVEKCDALKALSAFPDESVSIVSGFHIAEHLPFEILQEIVREAKRVLKPSGLLILETPNPENLVVGSCNFYKDPSHRHPLPPVLLSFLPEFNDFYRVKILRLQENKKLRESRDISLFHVIAGASPDYSIIAQKQDLENRLAEFDELFDKEYGLTMKCLCDKFDDSIRARNEECRKQAHDLQDKLNLLQKQINAQDARLSEQDRLIADLRAQLEAERARLESTQARLESTYNLLVNTRHRTLYGALAWLWHKLFKRKS